MQRIRRKKVGIAGILLVIAAALVFTSCGNTDAEPEPAEPGNTPAYVTDSSNDIRFMTDTYGLTEEELKGLDLARLIKDYSLRDHDYTAEEVREIIRDEGDMYQDDGTTGIYSIFDAEQGKTLTGNDEVLCIGFYENSGSQINRYVFDLENRTAYTNDAAPHGLTDNALSSLKELPSKYGISGWDLHTEGEEAQSTGNYAWKLVFYTADGSFAVYDGYTGDISHLPDGYNDAITVLKSAADSAK